MNDEEAIRTYQSSLVLQTHVITTFHPVSMQGDLQGNHCRLSVAHQRIKVFVVQKGEIRGLGV